MASPEATITVTEEQKAFYQREGYLAVDRVTSDAELKDLRQIYDRLFRERAGREEGNEFNLGGSDEDDKEPELPQILNPTKYAPELLETELFANVTALVKGLLGEEAKCGFAHCIYKPPRIGLETPWHQDASYWGPGMIHYGCSIWVPLQEATPENGCMHFVPGSHKHTDVLPHQSIGNDPTVHGNELKPEELWRTEDAVACPLPAGGATVHGGYMLHYTPPNRSEIPRRAIILSGAVPGVKRDEPIRMPWQEEKRTPRQERAQAAKG